MNEHGDSLIVVGIGASAGGVEALETMFSAMPESIDMAFVIVQHLSPDFESLMPQILKRKTELTVVTIKNDTVIEPNKVYVLPSGKDIQMAAGNRLVTTEHSVRRQQNPIDAFFKSLAFECGENAVGVILSGSGRDGSEGIQHIHQEQGLVIVQSEATCKFNGMPRSAIATGVVDTILHLDEIPDALIRFQHALGEQSGKSRQAMFAETMNVEKRIHHLLHRKYGIAFDQYKSGMFDRRLERRMFLTKAPGIESYLQRLEMDPDELQELYNDLLIGVTEFFRDAQAFNELQHRVLPELIEAALESGEFRVWIAPCATGEEAYSIAILIDELIAQRNYDIQVKIFATDINPRCTDFASRGVYSADNVANVTKDRLTKYFHETVDGYQIIPRIRKQIIFASHDLLQDAPFTKLNLVCCRNLLIYLKAEAKKKVLSLFNFSLKNLGVLFLGPSETITELESAFETIHEQWRIYRKIAPIRFSQVRMSINANPVLAVQSEDTTRIDSSHRELTCVYDELLAEYMPAGLLVDENNRLLHVFGGAAEFLQYKQGRPSEDLLELLPDSFQVAANNGLKRAKIDGKTVAFPGLENTQHSDSAVYRLTVKPVLTRFKPKYLITIEESHPIAQSLPPTVRGPHADSATREIIDALEKELLETKESLSDSILNLKAANEEMQSTNEELIASNEELQSTNEELHSVNEELYTVNSEHQRKITELTELTDDMDNLLDSLQVDTIFLDRDLRVRKYTLGIAKTFKLLPQDIGRDFATFNHSLRFEGLIRKVQSVLDLEKSVDEEVQDTNGHWYLMRLLPYNSRGTIDGVLLTLIDITQIKQTEEKLAELSEIVQSSDDAIFRITPDGTIRTWNRGAQNLFSHTADYVIGKNINLLTPEQVGQQTMQEALQTIQSGGRIDHFELQVARRNGEHVHVQMSVSPIRDRDRNLIAASVILRDFTEQKLRRRPISMPCAAATSSWPCCHTSCETLSRQS